MTFKILDCTLRDGGYYTKWDFDDQLVQNYMNAMAALPVSVVEIGYRNAPAQTYAGRYFYLTADCIKKFRDTLRPDQKIALMVDAKSCRTSDIKSLLKDCKGLADIIRIATDPEKMDHSLELSEEIHALGFETSLNLMYLSKQKSLEKILSKVENTNTHPDCVSLVDSYGGCFPEDVGRAVQLAKKILPAHITVGFHAHNNLSLAFANALMAIKAGADYIDSTLLGMGRGAGNLTTELISSYWEKSENAEAPVDFLPAMPVLYSLAQLQEKYKWGTQLPYIFSGMHNIPQKEVMEWLSMQRYSPSLILQKIKNGKYEPPKITLPSLKEFSKRHKKEFKECIIIGGGPSIVRHLSAVESFAEKTGALVIHVSAKNSDLLNKNKTLKVVCLVGDEKAKLPKSFYNTIRQKFAGFIVDTAEAKDSSIAEFQDMSYMTESFGRDVVAAQGDLLGGVTPIGLGLAVAKDLGIKTVYLAGFDGFHDLNTPAARAMHEETERVAQEFIKKASGFSLTSLLDTSYKIPIQSVYSLL